MTAHRRYQFTYSGTEHDDVQVHEILQRLCSRFWWYTDPYMTEAEPGFGFGFTVHARDQWRCHSRAIKLASDLCAAAHLSIQSLSDPLWSTLEPHSNRGFARRPRA